MRRVGLGAILLIVPVLSGAGEPVYTPPVTPPPADVTAVLVKLVAGTAAAIAICLSLLWYARKGRTAGADGARGRMTHKGTVALDRRAAVHLIEVDGQLVAVTTDATGVRSLSALSEPFEAVLARTAAEDELPRRAA